MSWSQRYPQINAAELPHRLAQLITLGKVVAVDYDAARVRVEMGEWTTTWLPWLTQRASNDKTWWSPEINEQVLVLAPCGDLAQGIVLAGVFQQHQTDFMADIPPAKRDAITRVTFQDGTQLEYNRDTHVLTADVQGDVQLQVTQHLTANVEGNAQLTVQGHLQANVTQNAVLTAENIQLSANSNIAVNAGGALSLNAGGTMKLNAAHISAQE